MISINLSSIENVNNTNSLNCQQDNFGNYNILIDGFVHSLSSIAMANLGCMPYPN